MAVKSFALSTVHLLAAVHKLEGVALSGRTLHDWIKRGMVTPSIRVGGRGATSGALWSLADLARVRLAVRLRHGGLNPHLVDAVFIYLENELPDALRPNSRASLVVRGKRAFVVWPGQPSVAVPSGQLLMDFRLATLFVGNKKAARRAAA